MSHALTLFALTMIGADGPPDTKPPVTSSPSTVSNAKCAEDWRLSIREAIRIGLDHSEIVRLVESTGKSADELVIAPVKRNKTDPGGFKLKAELMAVVRSIEQQYRSLAQQNVQLWAAEKAVQLGEEILKQEEADQLQLHAPLADIAEAKQRLEQSRLDFVTKTADAVTTERQLRNLLGLPPADGRRIVPTTEPTVAKSEPDWDASLAQMKKSQPTILGQNAAVEFAEKAEALGIKLPPGELLDKQREFQKQVIQQTTHSLARFYLEISVNYKQMETAKKFRAAAANRLEAQRAFYEEGRITVDRYCDAVTQYTAASSQEAQFKEAYSISLIAFEEAKGTLLEYEKITLVDVPAPALDPKVKATSADSAPAAVETWKLTLRDAIHIGLDNSDVVRNISIYGAPADAYVIAPLQPDKNDPGQWKFKAEVMAEVRSIEQVYWNLARQIAQLAASEKAIQLAAELLKREQDEIVGRQSVADIAEAQQRLDQLRLDPITKKVDIVQTEKQLRRLLGLPASDARRIVPITAPTEAKVEPNWNDCLAQMNKTQPVIILQRLDVELAEKAVPADDAHNVETLEHQRAFLTQVVHQTTHTMAQFVADINANYKQLEAAKTLRAAAETRLEVQRASYDEGRITCDRYCDAIAQHAAAVSQEAQFKSAYNVSLIALEEAKGTLLDYDKITVADPPRPRDPHAKAASFEHVAEPADAPQAERPESR